MKTLPNDITHCLGNKCCMVLKSKCKRWVENNKDDKKISVYQTLPQLK